MEGLVLEVRAETSEFEAALGRVDGLAQASLGGWQSLIADLQAGLLSAAANLQGFSQVVERQSQALTASGAAVLGYRTGLDQINQGLVQLGLHVQGAVNQVNALAGALAALPRQVVIDVYVNTHGSPPAFHAGGLVAGPEAGAAGLVKAHQGLYVAAPGPEERDVRVLTGEYVLSRAGVRTLGLDVLRAADQGQATAGASEGPARVEHHVHIDSLVRVDGSLIADEAALGALAERIGREMDWQTRGRTG